jgi:hypothetical protein
VLAGVSAFPDSALLVSIQADPVVCTGTYSPVEGLVLPKPCPVNSWPTEYRGATHVLNCTCKPGATSDWPNERCPPCPKGMYKDTNGTAECSICPRDTYNELENQPICPACPNGTISHPFTSNILGQFPTNATTAFCELEEPECTFCKISYLLSCIQSEARTCSLVNVRHRCPNQLDFDVSFPQVAFPCQGITFKETLRGLVPTRLLNLRIETGTEGP